MHNSIIDIHTHPSCSDPDICGTMIRLSHCYGMSRICLLGDVLAFGYDPDEKQIRTINDTTIQTVEAHPELFLGFCHLNPSHSTAFILKELDRCITEHGLSGIKLEVSVNARDERLDPLMHRARELGVPVLHHAWYKTGSRAFNESTPADIADLAFRFPDVTIIMAHLSGGGVQGIHDVKPHSNVYVDTSGSQPVSGMVEYAVHVLGSQRIVYGSDAPIRDFSSQIGRIRGASITEKQRDRILCSNAKKIFRLD